MIEIQCIYTMQRTNIGIRLLLAVREEPNAKIFFGHKLVQCDLNAKTATTEKMRWQRPEIRSNHEAIQGTTANTIYIGDAADLKTITFDFIIGADGAHSLLRQHMMRQSNMNYQQEYVDALWCDFFMPPAPDGPHKLDPTFLHVWPNRDSMFIALPDAVS